jgi:hypothetical protein
VLWQQVFDETLRAPVGVNQLRQGRVISIQQLDLAPRERRESDRVGPIGRPGGERDGPDEANLLRVEIGQFLGLDAGSEAEFHEQIGEGGAV